MLQAERSLANARYPLQPDLLGDRLCIWARAMGGYRYLRAAKDFLT